MTTFQEVELVIWGGLEHEVVFFDDFSFTPGDPGLRPWINGSLLQRPAYIGWPFTLRGGRFGSTQGSSSVTFSCSDGNTYAPAGYSTWTDSAVALAIPSIPNPPTDCEIVVTTPDGLSNAVTILVETLGKGAADLALSAIGGAYQYGAKGRDYFPAGL